MSHVSFAFSLSPKAFSLGGQSKRKEGRNSLLDGVHVLARASVCVCVCVRVHVCMRMCVYVLMCVHVFIMCMYVRLFVCCMHTCFYEEKQVYYACVFKCLFVSHVCVFL